MHWGWTRLLVLLPSVTTPSAPCSFLPCHEGLKMKLQPREHRPTETIRKYNKGVESADVGKQLSSNEQSHMGGITALVLLYLIGRGPCAACGTPDELPGPT